MRCGSGDDDRIEENATMTRGTLRRWAFATVLVCATLTVPIVGAQEATPLPERGAPFELSDIALPADVENILAVLIAMPGEVLGMSRGTDPANLDFYPAQVGMGYEGRAEKWGGVWARNVADPRYSWPYATGAEFVAAHNDERQGLLTRKDVTDGSVDRGLTWLEYTEHFSSDHYDEDGNPMQPPSTTYILAFGRDDSPWAFQVSGSSPEMRDAVALAFVETVKRTPLATPVT
jgi:hypothetical protein